MKLKELELRKKLATLRSEQGLTQEGVARELGITRHTVSRWERGTVVPSAGNLAALGRLYGVPLDELMNEEPDGEEKPAAPEALKAPETEAAEMEEPDGEEEPAVPEVLKVPEPETAEIKEPDAAPAPRRFSPLRLVGCAVLAGCILLTGVSIGIVIGVTVLKEPEKPKDGFTIVRQEDTEQEDIDWEKLVPFDGEIQDIE